MNSSQRTSLARQRLSTLTLCTQQQGTEQSLATRRCRSPSSSWPSSPRSRCCRRRSARTAAPRPSRTATLETVVEPPEEPRNTYWCVRHGQSTANVENIISSNPLIGSTKHELTALGKEQAHVAGADLWANLSELEVPLEDVVVYSSNFTRARETAQIAAYEMQRRAQIAAGDWEAPPLLQIGLLSDLRERDFGSLDGLSAATMIMCGRATWRRPFDGTDGVEPVADVCQRLSNMVDLLEKRHSGKQVILTAHADVIQIFQTWFAGCDVRAFVVPLRERRSAALRPRGRVPARAGADASAGRGRAIERVDTHAFPTLKIMCQIDPKDAAARGRAASYTVIRAPPSPPGLR